MFDHFAKELTIPVIYAIIKQHKGEILKYILSQFREEFAIPVIIVIMQQQKKVF